MRSLGPIAGTGLRRRGDEADVAADIGGNLSVWKASAAGVQAGTDVDRNRPEPCRCPLGFASEGFPVAGKGLASTAKADRAGCRAESGQAYSCAESSLLRLYADRGMASRSISHAWAGVRSARWGHPNREESRSRQARPPRKQAAGQCGRPPPADGSWASRAQKALRARAGDREAVSTPGRCRASGRLDATFLLPALWREKAGREKRKTRNARRQQHGVELHRSLQSDQSHHRRRDPQASHRRRHLPIHFQTRASPRRRGPPAGSSKLVGCACDRRSPSGT